MFHFARFPRPNVQVSKTSQTNSIAQSWTSACGSPKADARSVTIILSDEEQQLYQTIVEQQRNPP
jgi:hypothetical protein